MDILKIERTNDTPEVIFDPSNNIFQLSEMSLPEDAIGFYAPIVKWLEEYAINPNPLTTFEFNLKYYNTASAKQIAKIMLILKKIAQSRNLVIKWYFKEDDSDMEFAGTVYAQHLGLDFEFIKI